MSIIKLECAEQNLICTDAPQIFSGDINTDSIVVDFDETWSKYTKTAVFYRDKSTAYQVLLDENDSAIVPQEVMSIKGIFYIGIVGVCGEDVITSEIVKYKVGEGAISYGLKNPTPTQDIYEQILSEYNHAIDICVTKHDEKLTECQTVMTECQTATEDCYSAISSLQLEWINFDGGYPNSETDTSSDINGGYPQTA